MLKTASQSGYLLPYHTNQEMNTNIKDFINTYTIEFVKIVHLLLRQLFNVVRVREHVKFVNDIELDLSERR